jgi:hypothetical protein
MSRDREGVVSLRLRHPNRHRLPLFFNHIPNCCGNVFPIEQPTRTSMPRPTFSLGSIHGTLVQSAARIGFEIAHYLFWFRFGIYDCMNVRRPNMRRQKRPFPMQANLEYRIQHCATTAGVQQVRRLVHQIALAKCTLLISLNQAMSRNVVVPIHGTGFVAVQMRTIAGERNQVRHARHFIPLPHGRGSVGFGRGSIGFGRGSVGFGRGSVAARRHYARLQG